MPTREYAIELLHKYVKDEKMLQHCYASEVVLRALAERLNENPDEWGIAGLLHDIDVELTAANPLVHGLKGAEILLEEGFSESVADAVRMHNEQATGMSRKEKFQFALAAGETVTGLIKATALVYPDKRIDSVKVKSVVKRMKEKGFAATVKRENILECETLGLTLDEFVDISIHAMKTISEKIGL